MERASAFVWCVILWGLSATAWADFTPSPGPIPGGIEPGILVRGFADHDDFSFVGEAVGFSEPGGRQFRAATLGLYYQPISQLELGAFYRRAYGLRHDEDWNEDTGRWIWADSNGRGEDFLILDATPKTELPFLPGEKWTGEIKFRLLHDTFDAENTLMIRPGLTYFLLNAEVPVWNFFLQAEFDVPLNFSSQGLSERWLYLGALYHLADFVSVGGFAALAWQTWNGPPVYISDGGAPYTSTSQFGVIVLTAIFDVDF